MLFYLLGGRGGGHDANGHRPGIEHPDGRRIGAIAAVMGITSAYPSSPITILNPFVPLWFFFGLFFELPAWVVAVEFFVVNLMSGMSSLASSRHGLGGVAFFAHVGGFVAGLVLVRFFMTGRTRRKGDSWSGWRPPSRRESANWDDRRYR